MKPIYFQLIELYLVNTYAPRRRRSSIAGAAVAAALATQCRRCGAGVGAGSGVGSAASKLNEQLFIYYQFSYHPKNPTNPQKQVSGHCEVNSQTRPIQFR